MPAAPSLVSQRLSRFPPIGGHAIHPPHGLVGGQTRLNRAGIVIARPANTGRKVERRDRALGPTDKG
jgi:hypothetical protein